MQITPKENEGLKKTFTVTVPAADLEAKRDERLKEVGRDLKLPGFRPGKVPAAVVKQRFGEQAEAEALDKALQESFSKILQENDLRPATQPQVSVSEENTGRGGKDLTFDLSFEVVPAIDVPDMNGVALERKVATVTDDVLDKMLADIASRQKRFEDLNEDRPATKDDVLNVDFEGKLDGKPFEGGAAKGVDVELNGEGFIPGFAEGMVGMKPGEERTINVKFPADYPAPNLAGKDATFDIKAHGLKKAAEAKVDDELAKSLGLESLEKMKELLKIRAEHTHQELSQQRLKRSLLDELAKKADFEVPQGLLDAEFEQIWQSVEAEHKMGRLSEEEEKKYGEDLKKDYRAIAKRRVRLGLLLSEIAHKEGIEVSQEELARAVQQEAQRYPGQEKQVLEFFTKNPQAIAGLRGPLLEEKVIDHLLKQAKVEDKEVTPEELSDLSDMDKEAA
ncbi:trigger factor [Formicincola oecophyllae]|uniref:Trigger factor n=1 Tax=Formicincola oecophyllae TaxID=2558361 RepID=A0A4Y6U8S2_9PROT|nr:trigger factor [Formicincola oecophyllae]QDH12968.1 trigger factor [Formicincola oecophyllae]